MTRSSASPNPGLRVLVVDDERPARRKLRMFLEADSGIDVVYEAPDGQTAISVIRDEAPDIVFMDIRMPGLDGLTVVESLDPATAPHIVFVTAFDEYALSAFDLHAVDYLLKPFDPLRFSRALDRARTAVANRDAQEEAAGLRRALSAVRENSAAPLERILVEHGERTILLKLSDIERIDSDRNYVSLHAAGQVFRARVTMNELEARLDARRFARVARGTIVNLDYVHSIEPAGHGDATVRLRSGAMVRLSRRYRDRLQAFSATSP